MADKVIAWDSKTGLEVSSSLFAWGNVLRSSIDDVTFAVKNTSTEYVAKNVTVKAEDSGSSSPGLGAQHLFTLDEWTYVGTLSLGDIPPAGLSPEITMRRVTRSNAVSGTFSVLIAASSWAVQDQDAEQDQISEIEA